MVFIHELGHMLGLADDISTGGIMDTNGLCGLSDLLDTDRELIISDFQ